MFLRVWKREQRHNTRNVIYENLGRTYTFRSNMGYVGLAGQKEQTAECSYRLHVFDSFFVVVIKFPDKSNLMGKGFFFIRVPEGI